VLRKGHYNEDLNFHLIRSNLSLLRINLSVKFCHVAHVAVFPGAPGFESK